MKTRKKILNICLLNEERRKKNEQSQAKYLK